MDGAIKELVKNQSLHFIIHTTKKEFANLTAINCKAKLLVRLDIANRYARNNNSNKIEVYLFVFLLNMSIFGQ